MMPIMDRIILILIGVVVCAVFGAIVYVLAKKSRTKFEEIMKTLSEDVKEALFNAPIVASDKKSGAFVQTGYVHEIQGDGHKVNLVIIYFNRYYPNCMNEFSYGDFKVARKVLEENGIRQGSFVKIQLDENGGKLYI